MPFCAKAAYAEVIETSVTSPAPSANAGTLGTLPTPIRLAYDTTLSMPTVSSRPA